MPPRSREEFEIAIICALPVEADAVEALFDEHHDESHNTYGKQQGDDNTYITGRICDHHVVLAIMPEIGTRTSASVARGLRVSFTGIKLALVVGVCGGAPYSADETEIILGDVIISDSIVEYDFGRQYPDKFVWKSGLKDTQPNQEIRSFLNSLRTSRRRNRVQQQITHYLKDLQAHNKEDWSYPGVSQDILFDASYRHRHYGPLTSVKCICVNCHFGQDPVCELALKSDCQQLRCALQSVQRRRLNSDNPDTLIHIGTIASANTVMRSGEHRDKLVESEGILGFEMEGAGLWNTLPCVIIKGVCDYADSHKNKAWQKYAAATAASCTKAFLSYWAAHPKQQASDAPRRSLTVPFERDRMFVGREDTIMDIKESMEEGDGTFNKRAALVGLGGVGKSQIAIEYTYRVHEAEPDTWIFCIHASNATRFEQGYRKIAAAAEIPGYNNPKADILRLVKEWLSDKKNGRWLMILDNADDTNSFFSTSGERVSLVDYLPHGRILITSRNQTAARNLVGPYGKMVAVEPMCTPDAIKLLQTRINVDELSENAARSLVEALDCIPLAISQARAYIANRSPRMTVPVYLELFQKSAAYQEHLLNYENVHDLRRDRSIRHPVITTWQISFDQICHISPKAIDLLALMSMFDRQGIPENLIREDMDRLDFEDAVAPLIDFSLVQVEVGGLFGLHRLVQLSIRQWLRKGGQFSRLSKRSLRRMEAIFPNGNYETWSSCQLLLPHLKETIDLANEPDREEELIRTIIATRCGSYLRLIGQYRESETMHRRALAGRTELLGAEHFDTLAVINDLGLVLYEQGKFDEAEAMHRQAYAIKEKLLGTHHLDLLTNAINLGLVLHSQGKYEEAEFLGQQALDMSEKMLGAEHLTTLTSANNLGIVLNSRGRHSEAEAVYQRVLASRVKVQGPEHPETLRSLNNLASTFEKQGEYAKAEAMHRQALEKYEKILGAEHPQTLTSVDNYARVLSRQGMHKEAEIMIRRALNSKRKILGDDNPDTILSAINLGTVLCGQARYIEAEKIVRRALTDEEKVLGVEHPQTIAVANILGWILYCQDRYEEAESLYRRAYIARMKSLGPDHPDTLDSANHLGVLLTRQGSYEEAEVKNRQALNGGRKMLGANHPDVVIVTNNHGLLLSSQGKYEEAEPVYQQASSMSEKMLGYKHPTTLVIYNNLGAVLSIQGKYKEAQATYQRVLNEQERALGPEHPTTLSSVRNLGAVLEGQKRYKEAEALHRRALSGRKKLLGDGHPDTLTSLNDLSSVLEIQEKSVDIQSFVGEMEKDL